MAFPNPFDLQHHRSASGGDLVEQFLGTYAKRGTRRNYRTDLQQFLGKEETTRQEVSQIEEEDITAFLKQRVEDALKRSTLKRKLEAIRSFFRWLAGQNMIEEPPIEEGLNTGDLVDRIKREVHETTDGDEDSRGTEGSARDDQDDSERSQRGPVPMELEPGSEVNLDRETDSSPGKSSSPGSQPEVDGGAEPTPGPEHAESAASETSSREDLQSAESSSDSSPISDTAPAEESLSKEESIEERDTREEPVGEGTTEENSNDEDSDGKDQPSIPEWAFASGDATEVDLRRGENVSLARLPDALCAALPQLENSSGPEGLFIRSTSDLKVQIRSHLGEDSQIIEASIEHYALQRVLRNEGDLSEENVLRQAIFYLDKLNWTLPPAVYDHVDALPDPDDVEGPFSEERPRWRQEGTGDRMGRVIFAAQITGVLAEGFGIEKDEEVFVAD